MIGVFQNETSADVLAPEMMRALSPWSVSAGKRLFDLVLSSVGLLMALPIIALVSLVLKCSSRDPIYFRQVRVGRDGRQFELLKFRTMRALPGAALTQSGDPRITRLGGFLRRTKLDELPQLFNVLCGHMSLVGPRPDLPQFWSTLEGQQRRILRLRPGLTGHATLLFRDEERLLASVAQDRLHDYYVSNVLPVKVQMDLDYAETATLLKDAALIFCTLARICR